MNLLKTYCFPLILISSIILGGLFGIYLGKEALYLKPLGDIFLNLILTAIVPLIFFSVSSAISRSASLPKLGKMFVIMLFVFVITSLIAALYALMIVTLFPPAQGVLLSLQPISPIAQQDSVNIVSLFTVSNFYQLLSHQHILALIVFSILVGLAVAGSAESGRSFSRFLQAGEVVFMRFFTLIMYIAPIGFFAYFAVIVNELGAHLMGSYLRIGIIYYLAALVYFIVIYTLYAYLAGSFDAVRRFWKHISLPALTAIATCSGAASIPANLLAARNMKVPTEIGETAIPLGTIIHKEGSVIGGIFKIAFLFGIYHLDFNGLPTLIAAIGVAMAVGTVMGAIPGGGMLGELFILNVYGFPPSALIAIAAISIIIDPIATLLNVVGNTSSSMLIARHMGTSFRKET